MECLLAPRCCGTAPRGLSWPCPRFPQVPRTSPSIIYGRVCPEVPSSSLLKFLPVSTIETHQGCPQVPNLSPGSQAPQPGHSPEGSVPSHPNSLCLVPPGSRPAGRFSALIWVGAPGQPPLKLIQAVAGSQHCAQVCPLASRDPGWGPKTGRGP